MADYKEITVGKSTAEPVEVTIDLDEAPEHGDMEHELVHEEVSTEPNRSVQLDRKAEKQPGRAKKRIRELAAEKNSLYRQLEQERAEKAELMKRLQEGTKSSKEVLQTSINSQIKMLNQQIKEAIQNGEADQIVELQGKLMQLTVQADRIGSEIVPEPNYQPERPQQPQVSERAVEWVSDHPEFKSNPKFYRAAMATNADLLDDGYDPESDEFYAELDNRLAERFPEVFGMEENSSVEFNTEEEKPSKPTQKVVKKTSTVSGASRPPSQQARQRQSDTRVQLTPEDIAQANRWGWSLERFARRKLHMQKERREDGYVPIMMTNSTERN